MIANIFLAGFAFCITIYLLWTKENKKSKPPGPWGFPILGHLPLLGENPALQCMRWKKTYGSIISLRFGGVPVVVLNDAKIIKEALNLHSFSGRPLLKNFLELSESKGIVFTDGPAQAEQRQFAIKTLKEMGVYNSSLEFRMQEEISQFLQSLNAECKLKQKENKPIKIDRFFQFPVINSMWMTIMGERFEYGDPRIIHISTLLRTLLATNESISAQFSWFFNWWASLLCLFGINQVVNASRDIQSYMLKQIQETKSSYVEGEPENFTHAYFDRIAQAVDQDCSFSESRQEQKHTTHDLFGATIDTTTTTLDWLLLYMAREPEIQRKLQSEIDAVVERKIVNGNPTPPTLLHRTQMPYTEAIIMESLRISTVAPFAIFHRTLEDVHFHGYTIPKDTMVIPNLYGVHHDPDIWSEPERFVPERFLGEGGSLEKVPEEFIPFGFGKRSCIGEKFARDQLFLLITSFFQRFTVTCTKDVPSTIGSFGIDYSPKVFELYIVERPIEIK